VFLRVAAAILLVLATFNPAGLSYLHWIRTGLEPDLPLKLLGGIVLGVLYVIFLRATLRSIGLAGAVMILALIAALMWVLVYYGLVDLSLEEQTPFIWLALIAAGIELGIGMSWSLIRRALTGQADVDNVDE
ncbi:MAG: DUF6524 family protein, partial [Pseudomonadota bacterium]